MKPLAFIILIICILFSPIPVCGEVLSFPPFTYLQEFKAYEPFPSVYGWLDIRHHAPGSEEIWPAWIMDSGLIFTFFSWKDIAVEGMCRHIFLNRLSSDNYWLVWPLSLFTDLRLSLVVRLWNMLGRVSFHHDCKHDIEKYFERMVIHEAISLHITHNPFTISWIPHSISTLFHGDIIMRIHFAPFFQNRDVNEPDIFCLTLCGEIDPVRIDSVIAPFLQGELNLLFRKTDIVVELSSNFVIDWSIKAGIRFFEWEKGCAIYTELESLSDNWINNAPQAALLFSFGILVYVQ
jgi:hypothetical protein